MTQALYFLERRGDRSHAACIGTGGPPLLFETGGPFGGGGSEIVHPPPCRENSCSAAYPVVDNEQAWPAGEVALADALGAKLTVARGTGHSIANENPGLMLEIAGSVIEAVNDPSTWDAESATLAASPQATAAAVVLPPVAVVAGATLAEWSGRSWQWSFSLPNSVNSDVAETGEVCGYGQFGPIFFLAQPITMSIETAPFRSGPTALFRWPARNT